MFLIFWVNGKKYKLQGVLRKDRQSASFHSMTTVMPKPSTLTLDLEGLLIEFESVFAEPVALPPFRDHFHAIHLVPGS